LSWPSWLQTADTNGASARVQAGTSPFQALIYDMLGLKIEVTGEVDITDEGLKPQYYAYGRPDLVEELAERWGEVQRSLASERQKWEEARVKLMELLGSAKISGAGEAVRDRIAQAFEDLAIRMRAEGEVEVKRGEEARGRRSVCIAGCQFGELSLSVEKHEPYARVLVPLMWYLAGDASELEIAEFFAFAMLFDGSIYGGKVSLTVGRFGVKDASKALPLDVHHKVALWLALAAKYGVKVERVYFQGDAVKIFFDRDSAARLLALAWSSLAPAYNAYRNRAQPGDHAFKKVERMLDLVREHLAKIEIEHELREEQGKAPRVTVRFKEGGREIAHISIRWDGEALRAEFEGAEEKAKALASLLSAMGAEAEAKKYGDYWHVVLSTDSIASIRDERWLTAVRALVDKLREKGVIAEDQRERLAEKIEAGPNAVEIAGVEFSAREEEVKKRGKPEGKAYRRLVIEYRPRSPEAFDRAVEALKSAGFAEDKHFTAKRPEGGECGHIYLTEKGLWRLVLMAKEGVDWAERALKRLESVAKARGFYDLLMEYIKPVVEIETVDLRGVSTGNAVIVNYWTEWVKEGAQEPAREGCAGPSKDCRPIIHVVYEAGDGEHEMTVPWRVQPLKGGEWRDVRASVRLDGSARSEVLAELTGNEALKGRKGTVVLTSKDLFGLMRLKGIGMGLYRWYTEVV